MKNTTKSNVKVAKPENFRRLYAIVAQLPGYDKAHADQMIQALIWTHTKEAKYLKSDLTKDEYDSLCDGLCRMYSLKNNRKRIARSHQAEDVNDMWRKRVIAVINEWCVNHEKDKDDDYISDRIAYIKAIACRAATVKGREPKTFNSIAVSVLRKVYNEFLHQNQIHKNVK